MQHFLDFKKQILGGEFHFFLSWFSECEENNSHDLYRTTWGHNEPVSLLLVPQNAKCRQFTQANDCVVSLGDLVAALLNTQSPNFIRINCTLYTLQLGSENLSTTQCFGIHEMTKIFTQPQEEGRELHQVIQLIVVGARCHQLWSCLAF